MAIPLLHGVLMEGGFVLVAILFSLFGMNRVITLFTAKKKAVNQVYVMGLNRVLFLDHRMVIVTYVWVAQISRRIVAVGPNKLAINYLF